jgi:probable phosphoglycerate mutase
VRAAAWLDSRRRRHRGRGLPVAACAGDRHGGGGPLGLETAVDDGLTELAFGAWDGLTLDQVREGWPEHCCTGSPTSRSRHPAASRWLRWESRVGSALERLLATHAGETVLLVSHVTPIKAVVRRALDAPAHVVHRMNVAPGSLTVVQWWPDGVTALRTFSHVPGLSAARVRAR